jgi:hypothetical protein
MNRDCCPLTIALPGGVRAEYVAGSRPAKYTIDGAPCEIDVTIPDDLATGWYWSGSFLYQPWPERDDGPGVAISTGTYGVPGVFDAARRLDARRGEVQAMLKARPPKKAKKATKVQPTPAAEPEQMELAL